jgi:nucleoside-diphosphate-sugar epimerase
MRITVFGAAGGTGRLVVGQGLAAGHHVTAVTRQAEFSLGHEQLGHEQLSHVRADVRDAHAVGQAVSGADVVLSTLGVPFTRKPVTIYSDGARAIAAAMSRHGVKRLVVVSSSATYPYHHAEGGFLLNRVLQPLITATIGKTSYRDMRAMEEFLRGRGDLDWTVMRPSGLFDAPAVTGYQLHEDQAPGVFTSRADLAACMLQQATDTTFVRKAVAVTTSEGAPTLFQLLRREAFKKH